MTGAEYALDVDGDFCELAPEIYWENTQKVIRELILKGEVNVAQIKGLAFSSQGETLICIDEQGVPLRKAIVWLDNRSMAEAAEISQHFGHLLINQVTGQPEVLPLWCATRVLWLRKHQPLLFAKVHKYLLVEDFLIYKLTGKFVSEQSLVSSTLYYDIYAKQWWAAMLDFLHINVEKLPEVCPSGEAVGPLTAEASLCLGLSPSTMIVTGAYDHAAGAIGAGNIGEGTVTETTGASMAMVVTLDNKIDNQLLNLPLQCHAVANKFLLLPYGQTAGMVLRWFRDTFCQVEIEIGSQNQTDVYDLLTAQAASIPAGAEGLLVLPHLMGAGSPTFDPKAAGAFVGIRLGMGKAHFVRAIMEAVACMIDENIAVLTRHNIQVRVIKVLGGGAKSPLWNQIKADLTGLPIITLQEQETPSLGAAILAGVGSGVFRSIDEGCQKATKPCKTYLPDEPTHEQYKKVKERYQVLSDCLKKYW